MEKLSLDCHPVHLGGIVLSPGSVPLNHTCRPAFDDRGFSETVDMITYLLTHTLKTEPLREYKDAIVLLSLQVLKKNQEKVPKSVSEICESWMQSNMHSLSCVQDTLSTCMSIDVCLAVISRFESEKRFMEVLLEEREFGIIEDTGESLGRWMCVDKSIVFVAKCLEVLLKTFEISAAILQKLQNLFLAKLDLILMKQLPQQQSWFVLKRLKRAYIAELCRASFSTWQFDAEPLVLLKSTFELVKHEIDISVLTDYGNGKASLLKRDINGNLDCLSLIHRNRMVEALEIVCKDSVNISEVVLLDHERFEVFRCGILFLDSVEAKFKVKVYCDSNKSKETDVDTLWSQIVKLLMSGHFRNCQEMAPALLHMHNLQVLIKCHNFMELLDTSDTSTLTAVQNLPRTADLFSPVICSAEFLIKMFKELADLHTDARLDTKKQEIFDDLLSFAYKIANCAEVGVIKSVMNSCLDAFGCEKLNFFTSRWCREEFLKQLNLVINQLSESDSENFHDLAHLSLLSPFDTLHELISRGCSSAPLSKLVLKFFDQMTPLLLLQHEKFQQKEIITVITSNLKTIKKEKCQVMADFINKVMKIKHVSGSWTAISPYDILFHVLIPGLEKVKTAEGPPLNVLLLILKSVLNLISDGVKANSRKYSDVILTSAFCMMQILATYEAEALNRFCMLQNERQELHLSILNALKTVKSVYLDQNTMRAVYDTILGTLPDMKWQHRFYFVDLLCDAPNLIQFPIPSPVFTFSTNYRSLQFYGVAGFSTNVSYCLWILIFEVCKINMTIAQHFVEMILRTSLPKILDIVVACSQSLLESTNDGWQSVMSLIQAICQTRIATMLKELGFVGLDSMPEMVQCFFCQNYIISHSFLIALNSFMLKNQQVLSTTTQKIEGSFVNSMQELKDSDNSDSVNCFVILYRFASLLQHHMSNTSQILDSVILQTLEVISNKEQSTMKSADIGQWSQRYLDFKKYLASVNKT